MKNDTIIKERNHIDSKKVKQVVLTIVFSLLSLGLGFLIAFFGKGNSYVESSLLTAIITLFGFGLTSTVFVYQSFKDKETEKVKKVIHSLANTLLLTFILIIVSLLLDFIGNLELPEVAIIILQSLKYATLIYAFICQIDILLSFLVIVKNK